MDNAHLAVEPCQRGGELMQRTQQKTAQRREVREHENLRAAGEREQSDEIAIHVAVAIARRDRGDEQLRIRRGRSLDVGELEVVDRVHVRVAAAHALVRRIAHVHHRTLALCTIQLLSRRRFCLCLCSCICHRISDLWLLLWLLLLPAAFRMNTSSVLGGTVISFG